MRKEISSNTKKKHGVRTFFLKAGDREDGEPSRLTAPRKSFFPSVDLRVPVEGGGGGGAEDGKTKRGGHSYTHCSTDRLYSTAIYTTLTHSQYVIVDLHPPEPTLVSFAGWLMDLREEQVSIRQDYTCIYTSTITFSFTTLCIPLTA